MRNCGDGKWNPAGITPTTSTGEPSISSRRPITAGSPPSSCCQNPWLTTTTGAAPGRSSPAWNVRPMSAGTPRTSNSSADATVATHDGALAVELQRVALVRERGQSAEGALARLDEVELGAGPVVVGPEHLQAWVIGHRQRTHQQAECDARQRHGRAQAERQRADAEQRVGRPPPKLPQSDPQVAGDVEQTADAPAVTARARSRAAPGRERRQASTAAASGAQPCSTSCRACISRSEPHLFVARAPSVRDTDQRPARDTKSFTMRIRSASQISDRSYRSTRSTDRQIRSLTESTDHDHQMLASITFATPCDRRLPVTDLGLELTLAGVTSA